MHIRPFNWPRWKPGLFYCPVSVMAAQSDLSATLPSSQQGGDQHASNKTSERGLRGY